MAKQTAKQEVREFVAFADFEWGGKQYEEGDPFVPPSGFERDVNFEQFRNMDNLKRPGLVQGVPFLYQVKVAEHRNAETGKMEAVMDSRRVVLPVAEKASETPAKE